MRTLLIACGNPLRGDDGAASEALRLLAGADHRESLSVQQLTPELAEEAARFDCVVFLDADAGASRLTIERLGASVTFSPLTHCATPSEIVALARGLFDFAGEAYLCRIPASDFSVHTGISPNTAWFTQLAAKELEHLT